MKHVGGSLEINDEKGGTIMNTIFYVVGAIVVIGFILSFLGIL